MLFVRNIIIPAIAVFIFGAVIVSRLFVPSEQKIIEEQSIPSKEESVAATSTQEVSRPENIVKPQLQLLPEPPARIVEKKVPAPVILKPSAPPEPVAPVIKKVEGILTPEATATPEIVSLTPTPLVATPPRPPLNEDEIKSALVRIRCGNIYGSGFSVTPSGLIFTVAHVIIEAVETGIGECDVIFPKKHPDFGFYSETYYRKGTILTASTTERFYKEKGLDVAALQTKSLDGETIFPGGFPYINYPFCASDTLDDKILLFGYAANVGTSPTSPGSVLSRFEGVVLQYADVSGAKKEPSKVFQGGFDYIPEFKFTLDELIHHPVTVIVSDNNFSGASGGLVFDTDKRCIVGTNSAVGTASGEPRVFGFIYNFEYSEIKAWLKDLIKE